MELHPGTTSLIVVQPTPFCNIDCSYCYLPQRNDKTRLAPDQLREIFQKVLRYPTVSGTVTVVWHAGEPLVLGLEYYTEAFQIVREACPEGLTVMHSFQTNATLIDDAWCSFFRDWKVAVGISVDGPAHIHDAARKTRSGKGTYGAALAGVGAMQRNNVPFYVISVLTKAAVDDPEAMFHFYRQNAIADVGFNIEEEEGIHARSSLRQTGRKQFTAFLERFAQLMEDHKYPIAVRELEETLVAIHALDRGAPTSNQNDPFGILSIDVRGNVYTFSPELVGYSNADYPTFAIGNVLTDSFEEIRNSPELERMTRQVRLGVEMCRDSCKYFAVCGGGAPANKVFENGSFASTETMYCRLNKMCVTDFVLQTIEARYRL